MQRLRLLNIEEQKVKSEQDYKNVVLDNKNWFPSNHIIIEENKIKKVNDQVTYISYRESNNSYSIQPTNQILQFIKSYNEIEVDFYGTVEGNCIVDLYLFTYKQQSKYQTHSIALNSTVTLTVDDIDSIRLAIRISGQGKFELSKLEIKPNFPYRTAKQGSKLKKTVHAKDITVAMVVDEFTFESLKYECNAVYLSPNTWRETLENCNPDIFFCESAWAGIDPDIREWRGKIYSSINFKNENRKELLQILQYCKDRGIKTVFWNKEDPSHYEDKIHNFVDTAVKFDYIFTTSEECVERYKQEYNHKNVFPLMFAVQPKLFNPIETCERKDEVIFAGSYYRQHPARCIEMDKIFDLVLINDMKLLIYDRQYYNDDLNHKFPEKYNKYILPRLSYTKLDKAYKGSKYAININTETESKTMFARRVFELMASNTLVISNYSKGLDNNFGDLLCLLNGSEHDQEKLTLFSTSDYRKQRLKALRYVLLNHTYEDRFSFILETIGYKISKSPMMVTIIVFVKSDEELEEVLFLFSNQTYQNKKMLIVNTTNDNLQTASWSAKYGNNYIDFSDIDMLTKFTNLDALIESDFITIMDINYYYGPQYLTDMLLSYKYLDHDTIIAKDPSQAQYSFVSSCPLYTAVLPTKALHFLDPLSSNKENLVMKLHQIGFKVFNIDEFNVLSPENNNLQNQSKITV